MLSHTPAKQLIHYGHLYFCVLLMTFDKSKIELKNTVR